MSEILKSVAEVLHRLAGEVEGGVATPKALPTTERLDDRGEAVDAAVDGVTASGLVGSSFLRKKEREVQPKKARPSIVRSPSGRRVEEREVRPLKASAPRTDRSESCFSGG